MGDEAKRQLIELIEQGDLYGLILELAKQNGGRLTGEQIKSILRCYAEQEFPGAWANAGVSIRVGPIGWHTTQSLAVLGPLIDHRASGATLPPRG